MQFSKLVKKKNVFTDLEGDDRETAIREMVGRLKENGELPEDSVDEVIDGLLAREKLGTTGIGKKIAIPHVHYDGIDKVLVSVGHSSRGIDFAAVDGDRVRVVFLIISPSDQKDRYLEALRWVSSIARDEYNNKLLMGAASPASFLELFQDIEESS
jgi:mannitol/fructose-specific phosphotransferase system IIA component (Ntr-type)